MPVPAAKHDSFITTLVLLALLPLFMETFYYIVDVPPLYVMSKTWPILTLPLTLLGLRDNPPHTVPMILLIGYCLVVPPMMTMLHFGQSYLPALTGTVKTLPLVYYFSLCWLLRHLHPRPEELDSAFRILGLASLGLLCLLWVLMPTTAYHSGAPGEEISKLFLWDPERGYRITIPLGFAIIFIFLETRTALRRGRMLRLALPIGGVALLVIANKERMPIASTLAVLLYILFAESGPRYRVLMVCGGLLLCSTAAALLATGVLPLAADMFGGSLSVRQVTTSLAVGFLGPYPLNWIFGVGALTRASDFGFDRWFNDPQFYLADIGWLGVVFEYGIVGAVMLLSLYVGVLRSSRRTPDSSRGNLVAALGDYVLYMLITSPILPVVFAPGEVCSILAILVYLQSRAQAQYAG